MPEKSMPSRLPAKKRSLRQQQQFNSATPVVRALYAAPAEPIELHGSSEGHHLPQAPQVFFVKDKHGLLRLEPAEILYLQADGNYVEIHMDGGRLVLRNSMAELLKMLPGFLLCQANRSQAVNVQRVDLIGHDTVHIGQHVFTLTKHFRDLLLEHISVLSGR